MRRALDRPSMTLAAVLALAALATSGCDKIKPPTQPPSPQVNSAPPPAPSASGVRAAPS